MRYLIIGLGIYGSNLARDLTDMGHEVIGADCDKSSIDALKDYISTVYYIDATDETALSLLPLDNVDEVIVAIGENFGASIKVVALLKKMKVKHIYARAIDKIHESILEGFHIDRIITPEQRAARDLTMEIALGTAVTSMRIDEENYIIKFAAPKMMQGLKYADVNFEGTYKLKLIAVTRKQIVTNILGINNTTDRLFDFTAEGTVIAEGDTLTVLGSRKAYASLARHIHNAD